MAFSSKFSDWPVESFIGRTPSTSASIANFLLLRKNDDIYKGMDKVADEIIGNVEETQKELEENGISPDKNSMSFLFERISYPPRLKTRGDSSLLRPAIIDGCSLAFSYEPRLRLLFLGPSADLPFKEDRVLPIKPLIEVSLYLTLLGHKLTIFLPEYYRIPWGEDVAGMKKWKVDDIYSYRILCELGIIDFIDSDLSPEYIDFPTKLKQIVEKVGGCFFGDPFFVSQYANLLRKEKNKRFSEEEEDPLVEALRRMKVYENSSERMLSTRFYGPRRTLIIFTQFHTFMGRNRHNHNGSRKDEYDHIPEEVILFYTENDGEVDYEIRMREQLTFEIQIRMVLRLADLMELGMSSLRSVQCLLRFAMKYDICIAEIHKFAKDNRWK